MLSGRFLVTGESCLIQLGTYFADTDVRTVRDDYKLNRPDVGWYQVRNALKARNASGDTTPVNFAPFEQVYQTLSDKLRSQVFSLGFLR